MCRFTRIYWTQCGHHTLSSTPEHTELCETARDPDEELRQGYDKAPAFCHPLPEDLEELGTQYRDSDRIAQTNCLFTLCDLCKQDSDIISEPRGAGVEIEKPVEQFGSYTDEDSMDLAKWRDLLLSNAARSEAAIREFEELLVSDGETATAAIQSIRDEAIQKALLDRDSPERALLFQKTYQEADCLLVIAATYILFRTPRPLVNAVLQVIQDKLYQADLRLSIFSLLTTLIAHHHTTTNRDANQAALNLHAAKLAARLGAPVLPDPDTFSHLTVDEPQHLQTTLATAEHVRRLSTAAHASSPRTHPYAPRPAFGSAGKPTKALAIDVERAWNPAPDRRGDLPVLRKIGGSVEVVYDAELATSAELGRMGVGRWGEEQMLAQRETLGGVLGRGGEVGEGDETLVESPERLGELELLPGARERMLGKEATFMGMVLEDSDDEVGDAEDVDPGEEADGQDAGRQESVQTDDGKPGRQRDETGRLVKKRKCST